MIWTGVENIPRITIQVSKLKAWWVGGGGGQKAFFEFHFGPKFGYRLEAGTKLNKSQPRTASGNRSGWCGVGLMVFIRLSQFKCSCNCLLELSLAIVVP